MKINLLDRVFGNCEKGVHKFQSFIIKRIPPSRELNYRGYDSDGFIDSLTEKEYEVRCKVCGVKGV